VFSLRADCVSPGQIVNTPYAGGGIQWFNPNAYATPANGTFGNCGNGVIRSPSEANLDLSVQKDFPVGEARKVQFRGDFIDLMNHPILNAPSLALGGGLGVISSTQGPRTIQLALKFIF
jgi:hypothetical protein